MISFASAFSHIYLLSALFQPNTTFDITIFFIHQLQQKMISYKAIISEIDCGRTTGIQHQVALILKHKNAPQLIIQATLHVGSLLLRVFVLLCILLAISLVEMYQIYQKTINQHQTNKITARIRSNPKEETSSTMKLADSPDLLPTPPSEQCDVIPTASLPAYYYAPITKGNDDEEAVKPAPSEPTPPDHQKVKTKQQQTMLIDASTSSDGPHFNEEVSLTLQPEDLPNHLLATTNVNNQNGNEVEVDNISFTDSTVAESDPVSPPVDLPSTSSSPDAVKTTQTQSLENTDEIAVIKPSIPEAPDHAPTPSPASSTHATQTSTKIQGNETTAVHYLPPLSPSASLSSSLSTLNHIHGSDSHQENISGPDDQLQSLNSTSRLHHAYTEKQHQQQQQ
ncbi:hypothetical protein BCR42DRAFT_401677, partial [Absidia repens]